MSKILTIALIMLSLIVVVSCKNQDASATDQTESRTTAVYTKISPEAAKKLMDEQPSITVVDVRTRQEYEAGHIEGAMNIPNETIGSDKVDALPDLEATILLYCRSGSTQQSSSSQADCPWLYQCPRLRRDHRLAL
jgi:hypothetical protein